MGSKGADRNAEIARERILEYNLNPVICLRPGCGNPIPYHERLRQKCCSRSCSATMSNTGRHRGKYAKKPCAVCGSPTKNTCCSHKCNAELRRRKYISDWKSGIVSGVLNDTNNSVARAIRIYLFDKFKSKCSRCGWSERNRFTGRIPLTIEHIDGDSTNNIESNLDLICPNCHSLTATYGSLNNGRGRKNRRMRP